MQEVQHIAVAKELLQCVSNSLPRDLRKSKRRHECQQATGKELFVVLLHACVLHAFRLSWCIGCWFRWEGWSAGRKCMGDLL